NRTIFAFVCESSINQFLDDFHHLRNVLRCSRVEFRSFDAKKIEVIEEGFSVFFGECEEVFIIISADLYYSVIYVGEIHHLSDFVAAVFQKPSQQVLEEKGA